MSAEMTTHWAQTRKAGKPVTAAPARLTTTLYDVMTTLHTVAQPDEDGMVVAVVMHWLQTGRITVDGDVMVAV